MLAKGFRVQHKERFLKFVAQNPQLQEVVRVPMNLKILLVLWQRYPSVLKHSGSSSLAALYQLLIEEVLGRYRQENANFTDADENQLVSDLQTLALAMLSDGKV